MLFELIDNLYYLGSISYALPCLVLILKRRRIDSPLHIYVFINAIGSLVAYFFHHFCSNSFPVYHFSVFLSAICLLSYFYSKDSKFFNFYLLGFITLCVTFFVDLFNPQGIWGNNFFTTVFSNVILTLFSLRSLYLLLSDEKQQLSELIEYKFYTSVAVLIINSSSFFFSILENQIRNSESKLFFYSIPFLLIFNILFNILLSIGLWKQAKVS
jgi:hypothetical protein